MAAAGNTLDESIALIAAANTTIQDPGRVGTALKTLTMYLRASKTEAEEAGISTEGMAESISQLRDELLALTGNKVDIMSDAEAGSYKSTVEILRELSQVWDDLSDTSRTNITELIGGGVRNANIISALMNNFKIVEDAMATSAESSGSALAENEKYLDSINGKIQQFKASYETLSSTMFDSELIKGVVWLGTGLVDGLTWVADNLGPVLTALTAGSVVGSISNITELIKGLDKEKGLGKFLTSMKENGGDLAGTFKLLGGAMKAIYTGSSKSIKDLLDNLGSGAKWGAVAVGIGSVITVVSALKERQESLIETAQQNAKAYSESSSSLDEYRNKTEALIASIDSGRLSSEELYSAKSNLLDIQNSLIASYGSEAAGLNLISATADQAAASFDALAESQANAYLNENQKQINKAYEELGLVRKYSIGSIDLEQADSDTVATFNKIISKYGDSVRTRENKTDLDHSLVIEVIGNAEDALEVMNSISNDVRQAGLNLGEDVYRSYGLKSSFSDTIGKSIAEAKDVVDTYSKQATEGVNAAIYASSQYRDILGDLENAEDGYSKAASKNYDSAVERADAMADVYKNIDGVIESYQLQKSALEDGEKLSENDVQVLKHFDQIVEEMQAVQDQLKFDIDLGSWLDDAGSSVGLESMLTALISFVDESGKLNAADIQAAGVGFGTVWDETTANLEAGQLMYAMLANSLEQYNLTVNDAIPILKQYGIVSKSTSDLLGDATTAYTSAMSEHEAINTALSEQSAYGSTSLETYESLIAISSEYADCLSYQNGVLRINSEELQKYSEERANEKKRTIESSRALAELEYDEKTRELRDIKNGLVDYGDETENTIESLEREISELGIDINKYKLMAAAIEEATSARQKWLQAQSAPREDEAFTDAASALNHIDQVLNQRSSEIYGDVGTEAYKAALEFVVPQEVLDKGKKAIQDYVKDIKKYMQTSSGSITDINVNKIWKDIQHLFEEPDADGFRKVIEGTTLQDFADALGVTKDMAEALLGALNVKGFNLDWGKKAGDTFSDLADSAKESKSALDGMADLSGFDIVIDVSGIEDSTEKVERLNETIKQAQNIRAEFGVNSAEAEYAASIIAYCVQQKKYLEYETVLSVDAGQVNGELGNLISLLQQYVDVKAKAETEIKLGGETSSETSQELASVIDSIKAIGNFTLKSIGLDPSNFSEDKIEESLKGLTPELLVEIGIDPEAIANFKAENEGSIVSSTFIYNLDRTQVDSFKAENHNISATITYTPIYPGGAAPNTSIHFAGADGTAHAYGTARAHGDWGTAPGGRTLTGELGEELVVDPRSGRWYTVGSHGAEFVNLPKDAIVFNHLQTQALFNNGHIYGRGKAMANGNAAAIGLNNFDPASKSKNKSSALVVENAEISNLDVKAMQTGKQNNSNRPDFGKGNIDLNNRPIVENPNGGYSTVDSMSIGVDGKEVLIPTVIGDKVVSADEAIKHYFDTGEHLGIFDTIEEANAYADQLHKDQERLYASEIEALKSEAYENYQDTLDNLYDVYVSGGVPEPPGGSSGPGSSKKQESDWYYAEPSIPMDGEVGVDYFEYDEQFNDIYKGHKHLIEMEQEDVGVFLDWLESSYMNAYNQGILNLEDRYKYEEELREGRKEQFQDHLTDLEHEIERLGRTDGNELKIIDIYTGMIADLEKKISEAIEYGLDENSEYVQELTSQMYGYQDEIKDLQESALDDAKSALDELVDYRIDMLKKDIEDERDALDEKLSDLKDFYDKQKEMLQETYDKEKYLEEQSEKRKEKGDIQAEIDRLRQDDSAWAQKRILELQEELAEADKDLIDFEKDHALEEAQDALDKLYEKQEAGIQSQIEALEEKLNDPEALYNRALADIQSNTLALYDEMVAYNLKNGSGNAEDTAEMWEETLKALEKYSSTYGEPYKGVILVNPKSGYASGTFNASTGIHSVDELGPEYYFTSSDGTRYRVFSGGEKVLNAKATSFLYNFANSGGAVLSKIFEGMTKRVADLGATMSANKPVAITTGDVIIQGNADQSTVSELRRMKRDEMQWILKEFNKMNRRS